MTHHRQEVPPDPRDCLNPAVLARLRRLGPDFPGKLIVLFLEHTPGRLDAALAGGKSGDWKAVEDAAHSLKSSAGNLGAGRLYEAAERTELAAAEARAAGENGKRELDTLLSGLEAAYREARDRLEALAAGLRT